MTKDFVSKVNWPEKQRLIFQPHSGNEMFCNSRKTEPVQEHVQEKLGQTALDWIGLMSY